MNTIVCVRCGKIITNPHGRQKMCAPKCKFIKICVRCGKIITNPHGRQKMCAPKCKFIKICVRCGKEYQAKHRRQRYCSKECAQSHLICSECGKKTNKYNRMITSLGMCQKCSTEELLIRELEDKEVKENEEYYKWMEQRGASRERVKYWEKWIETYRIRHGMCPPDIKEIWEMFGMSC